MTLNSDLPRVLAGPLLRHAQSDRLRLWLVTTCPTNWRIRVRSENSTLLDRDLKSQEQTELPIGKQAFVQLLEIQADSAWPEDTLLHYDLAFQADEQWHWIADWAPHLCHQGQTSPHLVIQSRVRRILHGSCRKPHHPSEDGLLRVDAELINNGIETESRPTFLMMSGDQVYVDDVSGPMLHAIHQLDARLGLFDEVIDGAVVDSGQALMQHEHTYYRRTQLLPRSRYNATLIERFFGGARKPIFTTANAENHLVSFSEVLCMYLLVWSPVPWTLVNLDEPSLPANLLKRYRREVEHVNGFVAGLPRAARALCHVPCYMIFDDHDITDDWNLSQAWEKTAYEHPFSRRIVGNALFAYVLCQAWGNGSNQVDELIPDCQQLLSETANDRYCLNAEGQDALIEKLLDFRGWQYTLDTSPAIVVLDTRTHRWRRPAKPSRPSGLMDWEALSDFQQQILDRSAVVVVSPAPVFGVKLIEIVQRIFTFFGKPLLVDAENWMAHHEAATVMLSIFRHRRTPQNFVLLSGDVHYSFAYDVQLRYETESPAIWQITSSGIKNEFPAALIEWLDRLNRWLFAPWSPLNLLTQRRSFHIIPRLPVGRSAGERLWNHSGIGDIRLSDDGRPAHIRQLNANTGETEFEEGRRRE
ncbi:alkaline phosphatase family protein [Granulosicoccus sp. 3-233]|uniref:alkaline phosphatase family protein n=1 Tax=Granulosicoccus sp. 3-233 TaxID=3417969 RepID=UPI003D3509B8